MKIKNCKICGADNWSKIYKGKIRLGTIKDISLEKYTIFMCNSCTVGWLPTIISEKEFFYSTSNYRDEIGENTNIKDYEKKHDFELNFFSKILPIELFRDKVIVDVGCGGGLFLDLMKGIASKTIGIEPNNELRSQIYNKGHEIFSSNEELLLKYKNSIDIALCFNVLEHIPNPYEFVNQIKNMIKERGVCVFTTPNSEEFMMKYGPKEYKMFFYRKVHEWYFNQKSIFTLFEKSGFYDIKISFQHNYPFANAISWLNEKRGIGRNDFIQNKKMDEYWESFLIESGQAERLICIAYK